MYPKSINNLVDSLKYFPGIGEKTAERLAFSVLGMNDKQAEMLSKSIVDVKKNIKKCHKCNNISDDLICPICKNKNRNQNLLCVVEDPKTVFSIEKLGTFNGYYYVLEGLMSSFDGIDPISLRIDKLIERIKNSSFKEIIIAFKPCIEGEMTSLYIKNILSGLDITISRIASGIPMGADMEYVDSLTLERAFDNRKNIS